MGSACWSGGSPFEALHRAPKKKERLSLDDNTMTAIMKMAGGNPGAVRICVELLKSEEVLNGISALMSLDSLGIYESRIWLLYKDVCRESLDNMIACLRAWQFGILTELQITQAIDGHHAINVDNIVELVREQDKVFASPSSKLDDIDRVINLD
jgi:hypothetical protein